MMEKDQFAVNVAMLRCILVSSRLTTCLTSAVKLGLTPELDIEIQECNKMYNDAVDTCLSLLEKASS